MFEVDREGGVKSSVLQQKETHFSWVRTRLSTERTLMSWVRTAISLIGFGFTLFQFFEHFSKAIGLPRGGIMIWVVSLALIATGTIATALALVQYRGILRYLWSPAFEEVAGAGGHRVLTAGPVVAGLVGLTGIAALVTLLVAR